MESEASEAKEGRREKEEAAIDEEEGARAGLEVEAGDSANQSGS